MLVPLRTVPLHSVPLSERAPAPARSAVPTADSPAVRRLARWRDSFETTGLWQQRLAADGLSEDALLDLLAESEQAERQSTDWPETAAFDPGPDHVFARVAAPLLWSARQRVLADLTEIAAGSAVFDPHRLSGQLLEPLQNSMHRMLSRTMALEIHLAKLRGELGDGTAEERYERFLAGLDDPARQRKLFFDYPVLARQLSELAEQAVTNARTLATRLHADAGLLLETFADGTDPGPIDAVVIGSGDRHRGGQSVGTIRWASGLTVVYKPRPLAIDRHFAELLEYLNTGLTHPFRLLRTLDRGDYGWTEFITARPCEDPAAIHRFYHRQGALLALLDLLRTNDMHAENLIAAGEQPVLIDLETLIQPGLQLDTARAGTAENDAAAAARTSVLQVGLLPTLTWRSKDGEGVDISGLGSKPGQRSAMALPVLTELGTDNLQVRLERIPLEIPDHRPVGKDEELDLLDYADDLVAGFTELRLLCRARRAELLADDGPLAAFAGDTIRVLLRSTMTYATILQTGFHPDVLRDALERDRHFDYLWRQVVDRPSLSDCVPAEQHDLWRNDIPYFTSTTDGATLFDSQDKPIAGPQLEPGLELVRSRLEQDDDEQLAHQLWLIRGSLATAAINASGEVVLPEYELMTATSAVSSDELLAAASGIGDQLAATAFDRDGSAQWLGLSSQLGRNWTLGPLEPDLFNGLSGVALFLAELGRLTGESRHTELAVRAVATIRSQLARDAGPEVGGMAGQPGVAYTLARLSVLLADESLLEATTSITAGLADLIASDNQYDLVSGSAGTIGALRVLHELQPDGPALKLITAAADRLVETAEQYEPGVGWRPYGMLSAGIADRPLAGFGHGTAGIAWALGEAWQLTGIAAYRDTAIRAVAYERTLYDAGHGAWRDLRSTAGDDVFSIRAWCHGSVGIGLSRLALRGFLPGVDEEIEAALADARSRGFGMSHSLCHGDVGSIELLLSAAQVLNRPGLQAEADLRAAGLVAGIRAQGPICGVPFGTSTPSLMVGLSGIGHGLLRMAAPDRVASVATLGW